MKLLREGFKMEAATNEYINELNTLFDWLRESLENCINTVLLI